MTRLRASARGPVVPLTLFRVAPPQVQLKSPVVLLDTAKSRTAAEHGECQVTRLGVARAPFFGSGPPDAVLCHLDKSEKSRAGAFRKSTAMTIPTGAADGPTESDVRAALERIVASETFRSSPQLGAFLRFIVEEALAGRGASLKGYTIGVEALGRDPRFNPQIDPIVRVEATRLRRAMERYYSGEGIDDRVAIELPRGSYVPAFSLRRVPAAAPVAAVPAAAFGGLSGRLTIVGIVLGVGLLGASLGMYVGKSGAPGSGPMASIDTRPTTNGLPPGHGLPTIKIESLRVLGTPRSGSIVAGSLTEKLRDAFARFDTINV